MKLLSDWLEKRSKSPCAAISAGVIPQLVTWYCQRRSQRRDAGADGRQRSLPAVRHSERRRHAAAAAAVVRPFARQWHGRGSEWTLMPALRPGGCSLGAPGLLGAVCRSCGWWVRSEALRRSAAYIAEPSAVSDRAGMTAFRGILILPPAQ